jgi:glycosyltransferase involved in cell wall biosynthesis
VDDVRGGDGARECRRQGMGRMTAQVTGRAQYPHAQPARLAPRVRARPEADQLTIDMGGKRPCELERVALPTAEEPAAAEGGRSHMDHPHPLIIALLTIGDPGGLTGGHRYHRRVAELAPAHGARIEFVSLPDRGWPRAALHADRALATARERGADAVLLDSLAAAPMAPRLATGSCRPPLLAILHQPPGGIDHGLPRRSIQARLDRLAYRRALRLLAASQALADELVVSGVASSDRIVVVPPGRDPVEPGGTVDGLRRGRRIAVLCAGNWVPRKGIHDLLEAVARLPEDSLTLHLAGDDGADRRYAARLRARLRAPDLAARVVVHGPVPQGRLAALYAAADVFALPSLREPYGTVYGEAMAAGLPVVGWRAGNLPHLASDGVEGLVVEPRDLAGLAAALHRLACDDALRGRLSAAARRRAARLPTWEATTAVLVAAVRDALGE